MSGLGFVIIVAARPMNLLLMMIGLAQPAFVMSVSPRWKISKIDWCQTVDWLVIKVTLEAAVQPYPLSAEPPLLASIFLFRLFNC